MSAEISIDAAEGQILVAVQGETIAATASISEGVDPDEINEAIESLRDELHHSRRVGGIDVSDPFDRPNRGQVTLDPRFVCDECGFANVRLITANGEPAAKCTECGQGYLSTEENQ